ncbi:LOW QUALITY PROTEIN: Dimer_Tnp_hAT domain-containing protein, partial [Cephalotus follicularis]
VHEILIDRWNKNNTPLHCLAHALNPKYYSEQMLNEDPTKVPPHKDKEINQERTKCIRKYFPNLEECNKVNMEAEFVGKNGDFGDFDSIENRYAMDPKTWWFLHGACAPMLQTIALRLLAQPSSSSCAERNWSTYSFVHSMKRNKMTPKHAEDLVYIHSNLGLLSRKSPQYAQGETKMWDIGRDAFDSLEDVGVLEVASLSLDEPEMESIVFLDEVD